MKSFFQKQIRNYMVCVANVYNYLRYWCRHGCNCHASPNGTVKLLWATIRCLSWRPGQKKTMGISFFTHLLDVIFWHCTCFSGEREQVIDIDLINNFSPHGYPWSVEVYVNYKTFQSRSFILRYVHSSTYLKIMCGCLGARERNAYKGLKRYPIENHKRKHI